MVRSNNELRADLKVTGERQFKQALDESGRAADKAGDSLQEMGKDAGFLSKRAAEAKAEIKSLTQALDQTGDLQLLKSIRKEQRQQRIFEKLAEELSGPAAESGGALGEAAGQGVIKSLAVAIKAGGPYAIGGLVVLAASLAPLIGATIAAGVLGGVGAGGIAGGIAMAAQDARVKDAASSLGTEISAAFKDAGEPFIGATVGALGILKAEGVSAVTELGKAAQTVAPLFGPLAQGLGGLVREILPGFTKGLEASKPILRVLAKELPGIGTAVSDFISEIAEDSDGAIMAMTWLLKVIQAAIRGTGQFIGALERAFEWSVNAARAVAGVIEAMYGWMPLVGEHLSTQRQRLDEMIASVASGKDASKDFAQGLDGIGDSATKAADDLQAMKTAVDELFGKQMGILQATDAYEKSVDDLTDTLREGKRTLDSTTEAGRENRGAILDNIQSIKDLRQANIDNNMAVSDADAIYRRQIEQLEQTALKLGFNRDQVLQLTGAFKTIPSDVEVQLRVAGLRGALAQLEELHRLLGSRAAAAREKGGDKSGFSGGRAGGGPVYPNQTYVVGENGPEVLRMGASSGTVYNATQTQAMLAGGSGGSQAPWGNVTLVVRAQSRADQALLDMMDLRIEQALDGEAAAALAGPR